MFNNNEATLVAVREAVDAMREAVEALKKERDEATVKERIEAEIEQIKKDIAGQQMYEDLAAKLQFWLIRERAAFRRTAEWPTPKTDDEKATKASLDSYRDKYPEYTWEKLAAIGLDNDVGLESTARIIARKIMFARADWACNEAIARIKPFYGFYK